MLESLEFIFVPNGHLGLHRPKEGFHDAVVEAIALSEHRLLDPAVLKRLLVLPHLVLPPLVGMKDEALDVWVVLEGPAEHPHRLGEIRVKGKVPCDD